VDHHCVLEWLSTADKDQRSAQKQHSAVYEVDSTLLPTPPCQYLRCPDTLIHQNPSDLVYVCFPEIKNLPRLANQVEKENSRLVSCNQKKKSLPAPVGGHSTGHHKKDKKSRQQLQRCDRRTAPLSVRLAAAVQLLDALARAILAPPRREPLAERLLLSQRTTTHQ